MHLAPLSQLVISKEVEPTSSPMTARKWRSLYADGGAAITLTATASTDDTMVKDLALARQRGQLFRRKFTTTCSSQILRRLGSSYLRSK